MKPFRKNLAIAVDGGGIRGVIATKALSIIDFRRERRDGEAAQEPLDVEQGGLRPDDAKAFTHPHQAPRSSRAAERGRIRGRPSSLPGSHRLPCTPRLPGSR